VRSMAQTRVRKNKPAKKNTRQQVEDIVPDDLVREIKLLVITALASGEDSRVIEETLIEEAVVDTDEDWKELYHKEIPSVLRRILEKASLSCSIYHKKDDVPGYEYVANCTTKSGEHIALGFDIEMDYEFGDVTLIGASAWKGKEWSPVYLVYYHRV